MDEDRALAIDAGQVSPQQSCRRQAGLSKRRVAQASIGQSRLPQVSEGEIGAIKLKAGEEIVVGDHAYRIKDKFLKRFPADGVRQ